MIQDHGHTMPKWPKCSSLLLRFRMTFEIFNCPVLYDSLENTGKAVGHEKCLYGVLNFNVRYTDLIDYVLGLQFEKHEHLKFHVRA